MNRERTVKTAFAFGMTFSAVLLASALSVDADTQVFLLGGQSNMAGVGGIDTAVPSPYNAALPAVKFWDYGTPQPVAGKYGTFVHPWIGDHWVDLRTGFGHQTSYFGPEVAFGRRLHELFPKDEIYLVKEGISNSTLAEDWNPDGSGWVYNRFKERVEAALANLRAAGHSPKIAGMIWMQGESDAMNASFADKYADNLKKIIEKVRGDFNASDMPFVMGRILTDFDSNPPGGNAKVRLAQETMQHQPGIGKVLWINTDDLQLAYGGHYGTQGQIVLGNRFAEAFVVPEPGTVSLLGSGIMILSAGVWRGYSIK